jgi:serine/threonine-protein kinase RsbW
MPASAPSPAQADPLRLQVSCPPEKPLLAILRRVVTGVAEEIGFTDDDLLKIEMAVDEACANAFTHALPQSPLSPRQESPRGIELKVLIEPDALTIQIHDYGYEPAIPDYKGAETISEYTNPDREHYQGLGILIMKEFMDEVEFMAVPDIGTMVTLRKVRKAQPVGPPRGDTLTG